MRSLLCAMLLCGPAFAADLPRHELPEDLADADCLVLAPIKGMSRVLTPTELASDLHILIVDGRIKSIGPSLPGVVIDGGKATYAGRTCAVVDTSASTVTPGLVAVGNQLGLVEVSLEGASRDSGGVGPVRPSLRVIDGYNPRSSLIAVARMEGVTSAVIWPDGARLAGQAATVDLAGSTQREALVNDYVAQLAGVGGASRGAALAELGDLLRDARDYRASKSAYDTNRMRSLGASSSDLKALQPVLSRQVPLLIPANRASDIEAVLRFSAEQRVRVVILGAAEGWLMADALADAKVPVVINPLVYGPGGFRQTHARPDNAALLHKAGVVVVIGAGSSHNARLVRQGAGNAVREGLDHEAALRAITQAPAQVFGLKDRGRLQAGSVANLVVWGGDPLELRTSVRYVIIDGVVRALDSRQWRLMLRYQNLPGTPVPPLSLPSAAP